MAFSDRRSPLFVAAKGEACGVNRGDKAYQGAGAALRRRVLALPNRVQSQRHGGPGSPSAANAAGRHSLCGKPTIFGRSRGLHHMANVLIVDDDFDTVDASRELLESVGHRVRVGHSGAEGLVSLSAAALPDCLLLDVDMPMMNGPAMAHQMRLRDGGAEKVPILLVSGRRDLAEVAARMGTPYFLMKGSARYSDLLLKLLDRAIVEGRAPAHA